MKSTEVSIVESTIIRVKINLNLVKYDSNFAKYTGIESEFSRLHFFVNTRGSLSAGIFIECARNGASR